MLAATDSKIAEAERDRQLTTGQAAYDLARCYAAEYKHPSLFITVGFSGAGKSTLAREVSRRLPTVYVSSDEIRASLPHVGMDVYSEANRARVYDELRHRAISNLARGNNVILDATFLSKDEQERAADLATSLGAGFRLLECRCHEDTIRERLRTRESTLLGDSEAGVRVFEQQLSQHPISTMVMPNISKDSVLSLDTSRPVGVTAREVVKAYLVRSD